MLALSPVPRYAPGVLSRSPAVACDKCGRAGRYRVTTLAETIGWDGKLIDWFVSPNRRLSPQAQDWLQRPVRRAVSRSAESV